MKKIFKSLLWLIIIGSSIAILIIVSLIYRNYSDTKHWNKMNVNEEVHKVPPQLATDYVSQDNQKLMELLSRVDDALSDIEDNDGIDEADFDDYRRLHEDVSDLQEGMDMDDNELTEPVQTLKLYLDIEQGIRSSYDKPDDEKLSKLTDRLANRFLEDKETDLDEVYMGKLEKMAGDYAEIQQTIDDIDALGDSKDNTLTIKTSATQDATDTILNHIDEHDLTDYRHIGNLQTLLTSSDWDDVLKYTKAEREYNEWQDAKGQLEALAQSDYLPVSAFQTYQDVKDAGYSADIDEKDGYTVDDNSPVTMVTVDGEEVANDAYFYKSADVAFAIDEEYIEKKQPKQEKKSEKESEKEDESSSNNDDESDDSDDNDSNDNSSDDDNSSGNDNNSSSDNSDEESSNNNDSSNNESENDNDNNSNDNNDNESSNDNNSGNDNNDDDDSGNNDNNTDNESSDGNNDDNNNDDDDSDESSDDE